MDDKKDTPIVPEETPVENPEETAVEAPEDETMLDAVKSFLKVDKLEPEELPTSEEKPQEEVVLPQETPKEEPVVEKEPEIPLKEIAEEIKNKTKEEVKEEILKALGMSKEEKEVVEDAGYKTPWEKRGEEAPKDWLEVLEAATELQEFKRVQQEKELTEKQTKDLAIAREREQKINMEWDDQLADLRNDGLIPPIDPKIEQKLKDGKILTALERQDPGLMAQAGIFEAMYEVSKTRKEQGKEAITDVVHIFHKYYKKPEKPAGASAPVSGGSTPIENKEEEIPYDKIHNASSFEDLL